MLSLLLLAPVVAPLLAPVVVRALAPVLVLSLAALASLLALGLAPGLALALGLAEKYSLSALRALSQAWRDQDLRPLLSPCHARRRPLGLYLRRSRDSRRPSSSTSLAAPELWPKRRQLAAPNL